MLYIVWIITQCLFPDRSWISTTGNSWTLMMTYMGSGLGLVTGLTSPLTSDGPSTWPGLGAGLLLSTAVSLSTWVISNCLLQSQSRLGEWCAVLTTESWPCAQFSTCASWWCTVGQCTRWLPWCPGSRPWWTTSSTWSTPRQGEAERARGGTGSYDEILNIKRTKLHNYSMDVKWSISMYFI